MKRFFNVNTAYYEEQTLILMHFNIIQDMNWLQNQQDRNRRQLGGLRGWYVDCFGLDAYNWYPKDPW